jgi:hypothetical protein
LVLKFSKHYTVNHQEDQYVRYWNEVTDEKRPDGKPVVETTVITTNTIESYFSVFKRGMLGTYQHCSEKHLHRYLAEFDFRHNNRIALGVDDKDRDLPRDFRTGDYLRDCPPNRRSGCASQGSRTSR